MSALWSVCKFFGLKGAALLGLGATGVAYHKSNEELKKDMLDGKQDNPYYFKQQADDFVQKTVLPLAKDGVQGLTSLTTATLSGAAGLASAGAEQAPKVAEQAGTFVGDTTAASKETSDTFFRKFVPKGWEGWATFAAVLAGGGWIATTGKLGDGPKNFANKIFDIPGNLLGAIATPVGAVLGTVAAIAVTMLALPLLFPEGRQRWANYISDFFPGKAKTPEHAPGLEQHLNTPAPAIITPAPKALVPETSMPNLDGIAMNDIRGGDSVMVAPTRSRLDNDPALNPRRDIKNSPPVSMSS